MNIKTQLAYLDSITKVQLVLKCYSAVFILHLSPIRSASIMVPLQPRYLFRFESIDCHAVAEAGKLLILVLKYQIIVFPAHEFCRFVIMEYGARPRNNDFAIWTFVCIV